jgi:hypothetical protein
MSTRLNDVRQPRSARPSIVDTPRLAATDLQKAGAFVLGECRAGEVTFPGPDCAPAVLSVRSATLVPETGDGWIEFTHADGEPYRFGLARFRYQADYWEWLFVDPSTGRRYKVLYCPTASRFAPSKVHGLRVPSDSDSIRQRPMRRLQRLQARLAALVPDDGRRIPDTAKIDRLRMDISISELNVLHQTASLLQRPAVGSEGGDHSVPPPAGLGSATAKIERLRIDIATSELNVLIGTAALLRKSPADEADEAAQN